VFCQLRVYKFNSWKSKLGSVIVIEFASNCIILCRFRFSRFSIDFSFDFLLSFISYKLRECESFIFFNEFCLEIDNWHCYIDWSQCFTWELDNSRIFNITSCFTAEIALILVYTTCIEVCSIVLSRLISAISFRTRLIWSFTTVIASRCQNWASYWKLKGIACVIEYISTEIDLMKPLKCISSIVNERTIGIWCELWPVPIKAALY
jgi:hypothetical protein